MSNIKTWALTLAAWSAITYLLCVAWCSVAPEGWHVREFLELMLPGFVWISLGSFVLGLVESILTGAYAGALAAFLHGKFSNTSVEAL
jgi:hypothetical protein